ncbi:NAD regulator [Actinomycetota bacterium]|jgi:hypothetical protein
MRHLSVTLDAVMVTMVDDTPRVLLVDRNDPPSLPSGPLDPDGDETLTLGLTRLVSEQTGVSISYVEQLYTFGDRNRSTGPSTRDLAIGYVALTDDATTIPGSTWVDLYTLFPWEDHRGGTPSSLQDHIEPALEAWAGHDVDRFARERITFGLGTPWDPIRVLERYEMLFEAGLVTEASDSTSPATGVPLAGDHRRIAATALGRLRGKLTYRPVVFEVMPEHFTLTELQTAVEAIVGIELHKQNFRRIVERGELVEATGDTTTATGGRPAALYRFRPAVVAERPRPGFPLPRPRRM